MANQLFEYLLTECLCLLLPTGPEIDYSNDSINEFPVDQACRRVSERFEFFPVDSFLSPVVAVDLIYNRGTGDDQPVVAVFF
jgi:hypothetical protein